MVLPKMGSITLLNKSTELRKSVRTISILSRPFPMNAQESGQNPSKERKACLRRFVPHRRFMIPVMSFASIFLTPQNLCKNSGCERPEIQSGGFFLQYWKAALPGLRRNRADQSGCTVFTGCGHPMPGMWRFPVREGGMADQL